MWDFKDRRGRRGLGVEELEGGRQGLVGAFRGGEVAAAGEFDEDGAGDEFMQVQRAGERGEVVLRAPDEEDGHLEGVDAEVEDFPAVEHAGERAVYDPGVLLLAAEQAGHGEVWQMEDVVAGLDPVEECVEFGGGGGVEHAEGEVDGHVEAGAVEEQEAAEAGGVVEGELHGDPAAHGPAGDVCLRDVEDVEEAEDDALFAAEGVVASAGAGGTAVAEEVDGVDVVAGAGERGDHDGPVAGAGAEAVNEDDGPVAGFVRGRGFKVVDAVAIDDDFAVVHVALPEVDVAGALDEPEGVVADEEEGAECGEEKLEGGGDPPFAAGGAAAGCAEGAGGGHFNGFPNSSAKAVWVRLKRPPWYFSGPLRWPMASRETTQ